MLCLCMCHCRVHGFRTIKAATRNGCREESKYDVHKSDDFERCLYDN